MKTVAITQARMGSTRLPGKVLIRVAGKTLLEHHLSRVAAIPGVDAVVVAIPDLRQDDPVAECARALGFATHRGPENDVLERFRGAAVAAAAEAVVRVTSDCPLLDPAISGLVVARLHQGGADYVSNTIERSYPRGLDTEATTMPTLLTAAAEAREQPEREHVTPFIYWRPQRFRVVQITAGITGKDHWSDMRWTVDTPEDLDFVSRILTALPPGSTSMAEVLALLAKNPGWADINRHIQQKPVA